MRRVWQWGAINMALAVALGAFGAHGLKATLDDAMMEVYRTGVLYHLAHALGLLLIAAAAERIGSTKVLMWSARFILLGIGLFSMSLYVLAITGVKALGAITPLGGVCFIAGWVLLAIAAGQSKEINC